MTMDVSHENVKFSENTIRILPKFWFEAGKVKVTFALGVVTDDPHAGTAVPNPANPITPGMWSFNVTHWAPPAPGTSQGLIQIGSFSGNDQCYYVMSSYECLGFEECSVFVKPMGNCGSDHAGTIQERSITYRAQQHIAREGFKRSGGDGRDQTVLSYAGGLPWPEVGIVDIHELTPGFKAEEFKAS